MAVVSSNFAVADWSNSRLVGNGRILPHVRDHYEPKCGILYARNVYLPAMVVSPYKPLTQIVLSPAVLPVARSSFSETLGRRTIYVVSFSLSVVFSILTAISTTTAMLIVFRVLGGGAAASVQAVGAGTIADLWEPFERGRAMGA